VLSHELRHALQDQYVDVNALLPKSVGDFDDRSFALVSLLEGDAILVMERFLGKRLPGGEDRAFDASGFTMPVPEMLPHVPPVLRDQLMLPYAAGRSFANAVFQRGGWPALRSAWTAAPASSEQVLHPEKYFAREEPLAVEPGPAPPGGTLVQEGVLGEAFVGTLLGEAPAAARTGWGGDRFRTWDVDAARLAVGLGLTGGCARVPGRALGRAGAPRCSGPRSLRLPPALRAALDRRLADRGRRRGDAPVERRRGRARGRDEGAHGARSVTGDGPGPRLAGLPEELWALGCYVPLCGAGALVSVLVLPTVARRRPRLRFHATQGLLLFALGALAAVGPWLLGYALETAGLPSLGVVLVLAQLVAGAAVLTASVWLMVTSYHRRDVALPVLGRLARRWSGFAGS
jgi:uncharacterized membrane protein